MSRFGKHIRRPALLAVLISAAMSATACTSGGAAGEPAASTTRSTIDLFGDDKMKDPSETVTYRDDTLFVGTVGLPQFPGYETSILHKAPIGWPMSERIVLNAKVDRFEKPVVSAAVFKPAEPSPEMALGLIELAEKSLDVFENGDLIDEGMVSSATRQLHVPDQARGHQQDPRRSRSAIRRPSSAPARGPVAWASTSTVARTPRSRP